MSVNTFEASWLSCSPYCSQIRAEAQNSPTLNTRSSADQISIDAVPGEELVFEMVSRAERGATLVMLTSSDSLG